MMTMLSLMLAAAPAHAESVSFLSQDKEWVNVYVDGRQVGEIRSFDLEVRTNLAPGVHRVEIKDFMDRKVLDGGWLTVRPGLPLTIGVYEKRDMVVYQDPRALSDAPPGAYAACEAHPGKHQGHGHGKHDTDGRGSNAVRPGETAYYAPGPVQVELMNIDGTWANIRIDGRLVAELRGPHDDARLTLNPGVHTVQVSDFMDRSIWSTGQLVVGCTGDLKIGIDERRDPVVYNDPLAWI